MNCILILLISFVSSQNFIYNIDDWFTVSNPGYITSIATTKDEVIISAKNGVYSYNKYTEEFLFIEDFVRKFNSNSSDVSQGQEEKVAANTPAVV